SGGSWSSSAAGVATVNASTGVITGVAAGTATITYTVTGTGGCADATAIRVVTVNGTSSSSIVDTICQGAFYAFGNQVLTNSGTYVDTSTSFNGCDSVITLNLTVLPKPSQPQISVSSTIDTLFASPSNNVTWFRNGVLLAGGSNGVLVITQNGVYSAIRDSLIGTRVCTSDTSLTLSLSNVGYNLQDDRNTLRVYPVPTSSQLRLEGYGAWGPVRIRISDLSGRQIHEGIWMTIEQTETYINLDVSGLSNGIYQLQIENDNGLISAFTRFNVSR
ncbi:MAG: T9SS type A sorting domain-containing protein, partial [Bacteroidota bacterium]